MFVVWVFNTHVRLSVIFEHYQLSCLLLQSCYVRLTPCESTDDHPPIWETFDSDTYKMEKLNLLDENGDSDSQMNIAKISQTFPNAEVIE